MDLVEQKKLVEQALRQHLAASVFCCRKSLTVTWKFEREFSFKNPVFWKYLIQLSNEFFLAQFKDNRSLDKSFRCVVGQVTLLPASLLRARFRSIKDFFGKNPAFLHFIKSRAEFRSFINERLLSQSKHSCTGPPKGFVPLPDAEIGGCARNDSLTAPAIN